MSADKIDRRKTTDRGRYDTILGYAALTAVIIGCFLVLRPFLSAIAWAAVLAFAAWPIYRRLEELLRGRKTLAALLMTLLAVMVLLAPFYVVWQSLGDNFEALSAAVRAIWADGLPDPPAWVAELPLIGERLAAYWQSVAHDTGRLGAELRRLFDTARPMLFAGGLSIGNGILQLTVAILIAFFFFRDGRTAAALLTATVNRMAGARGEQLVSEAGNTVLGVVYGILGTALAQGVVAGVGFVIADVPGAILLGFLTFLMSIVPSGPPLVWIPVAIWLFVQGRPGMGVFMLIWGMIVSSIDNVIKPMIISRGSNLSFMLVLLGVLGGAFAFGFLGVFLGPTLLAIGLRLLNEWTARGEDSALTAPPR